MFCRVPKFSDLGSELLHLSFQQCIFFLELRYSSIAMLWRCAPRYLFGLSLDSIGPSGTSALLCRFLDADAELAGPRTGTADGPGSAPGWRSSIRTRVWFVALPAPGDGSPLVLRGSPARARAVIFRQHPVAVASGLRTSGPPAGGRLGWERFCSSGVVGFLGFLVAPSSSSLPYDVWNLKSSLAIPARSEVITPAKRTFRGAVVLIVRVAGATTSAYPVLRRWANIGSVAQSAACIANVSLPPV